MVTTGATANTTEGNNRASRESGSLRSHSHGESIDMQLEWYQFHLLTPRNRPSGVLAMYPDLARFVSKEKNKSYHRVNPESSCSKCVNKRGS